MEKKGRTREQDFLHSLPTPPTLPNFIKFLGLLANSVAIIIGAMIIAPLMAPIVGMAYSVAIGNRKLLRRSSLILIHPLRKREEIIYLKPTE